MRIDDDCQLSHQVIDRPNVVDELDAAAEKRLVSRSSNNKKQVPGSAVGRAVGRLGVCNQCFDQRWKFVSRAGFRRTSVVPVSGVSRGCYAYGTWAIVDKRSQAGESPLVLSLVRTACTEPRRVSDLSESE